MNIPMFFEKRAERRRRLTGLLPGPIYVGEAEESLDCKPVDVSKDGLGIVTNLIMKDGTELTLKTKEGKIKLAVAWGQPDFGKRDLYRYGLKVVGEEFDMQEIFIEGGCLK